MLPIYEMYDREMRLCFSVVRAAQKLPPRSSLPEPNRTLTRFSLPSAVEFPAFTTIRRRIHVVGSIETALISVSDKKGIVEFCRALAELKIELVSTGGTASLLRDNKIAVKDVSELTGFPEMMDGRVKTLHPKIHGGILALRDNPAHVAKMKEHGILPIDLVVVNLYPFEATVARGAGFEEIVENIDIGGPSMVRAAAKNHQHVGIVVDPEDYHAIVAELKANQCALAPATHFRLFRKAFEHTARYDGAISNYFSSLDDEKKPQRWGETVNIQVSKIQ